MREAARGEDGLGTNANEPDSAAQSSSRSERGGYGFERLERSVNFLVEEHERLTGERAALLEELVEREQRIIALESQLQSERTRRLTAVEGVDKILGRLEQLQASVTNAAESA